MTSKNRLFAIDIIVTVAMSLLFSFIVQGPGAGINIIIPAIGMVCMCIIFFQYNFRQLPLYISLITYLSISPFLSYHSEYALYSLMLVPGLMLAILLTYKHKGTAYFVPGLVLGAIALINYSSPFTLIYFIAYTIFMLVYLCIDSGFAILKLLSNLGIGLAIAFIISAINGGNVFVSYQTYLSSFAYGNSEVHPLDLFARFIVPETFNGYAGFTVFLGLVFPVFIMYLIYIIILQKFSYMPYKGRYYRRFLGIVATCASLLGIFSWIAFGVSGLPFFGFLTKLTLMTIIPLVGVFIILFPRAKVDDFNKNRYNFSVAVAMTALVLIVISTWVQAPLSLIYAPLMAIIFGITVNKFSLGVKNIVVGTIFTIVLLAGATLGIINNILIGLAFWN